MTLDEQIRLQARKLPPEKQAEVMDFIAFLQQQVGVSQPVKRRSSFTKPSSTKPSSTKPSLKRHAAFGSWKRRKIDALKYQRNLRAEWDH